MSKNYQEIETWIVQWLVETAGVSEDSIALDIPFADFGLDSVDATDFSYDLEEWLGIELNITVLWNHPTVGRMATYLDTKVNGHKESKDDYNYIEEALEAIEGMNEEEVNRALGEENV